MQLPFYELNTAKKLENSILLSILLFVFKIIFSSPDTILLIVVNELLVFAAVYFWLLYIIEFVHSKIDSPLSLILNAGILNALIFFVIAIVSSVFEKNAGAISNSEFILTIFYTLISFVFIGSLLYIFATFRELFFHRQKKDPHTYFNTLLLFFALSFFSNILLKIDPNFDYPKDAFFVVSIVLISINSLRVAWIAFLAKKQKIYLLIISTVLTILFGFNFYFASEQNLITVIIYNFSPGLQTIFSLVMIYGAIYFGVIFFTALFHLPTAEAFDRKVEEISSLMDLSKLITQVFDFKELADTITALTTKVCNSDSAWLVTVDDDISELQSVNNIGYVEADKLTDALLDGNISTFGDVKIIHHRSVKVKIKTDVRTFNFKSIVVAPLKVHNRINGFLFAARKHDYSFDEDDKKAVSAYADYAAVALENAKLIEESLEKERLEKELEVAREIQYKILPNETPVFDNLEISALFVPAFEVGGDYYDFFEIGKHKMGFVVADVSGKGISAAFIMAEVKGIFESLAKIIDSPKELLIKANDILKHSLEKKSFVTAVYGIIDTKTGVLNFSRVGHTPIIYLSGGEIKRLIPPGIGLGLDYGKNFADSLKEMEIQLNNNDIITFYSDGIPESQNAKREEFGYERFENIIAENYRKDTEQISSVVMKELSTFSKDNFQHDDITLVLFKWKFNNK